MKRVFIAIKVLPGEKLQKMIGSLKYELRDDRIKWTELSNIHITLAFLGNTEEHAVNKIVKMVQDQVAYFSPFSLKMRGIGVFRNFSDPKVLWTGLEKSETLQQLSLKIRDGLTAIKTEFSDKEFNPHLTLGRIKSVRDKNILKDLALKFENLELQIVPVNEVIVYESVLLPQGPLYKPLSAISLQKQD